MLTFRLGDDSRDITPVNGHQEQNTSYELPHYPHHWHQHRTGAGSSSSGSLGRVVIPSSPDRCPNENEAHLQRTAQRRRMIARTHLDRETISNQGHRGYRRRKQVRGRRQKYVGAGAT